MAGQPAPSGRQGTRTTRIARTLPCVVALLALAALLSGIETARPASAAPRCGTAPSEGPTGYPSDEPPAPGEAEPPGESSEEAAEVEGPEEPPSEPEPPILEEVWEEPEEHEEAASSEAPQGLPNCPAAAAAPPQCLLRSFDAHVVVVDSRRRVRLLLRYSAFTPTRVVVEYRFAGGRGPVSLKPVQRHLGERGVLRLGERLTRAEMPSAIGAREAIVELRVTTAPPSCGRYGIRRLTGKRKTRSTLVWSERP